MDNSQIIIEKVEQYRQEIIEIQRALVATPALGPDNGGQGEAAKAALVQGWLEAMGLAVQRVDAPDPRAAGGARPNVAATYPGGPGRRVWVLSHLDVVPPGDAALWSSDPWRLRVDGDKLYGRGVNDNHAGLVSSLIGLKALIDLGIKPAGDVGLILVSDEETSSKHGLAHVLEARPDLFGPDDLIIVPDSGLEDGSGIEVVEKSMLWLRVEVIGRQVHASMPHKGVNALHAAARMICAVGEIAGRYPQTDPRFDPPGSTMQATRKDAGVQNINTVPGRDVFYLDCRMLPGISLGEVIAEIRRVFEAIAAEDGATVDVEIVQKLQAPPATPDEAPVVLALRRAVKRVLGLEARPYGIGGGTVAAFFRQKGLPAAVWQTAVDTAHMPDEWISLDGLIKDAAVFALVYAGFEG